MTDTLSIVIPMMNEEDGLDHLFERLTGILDATGLAYEIVCVNDGSVDGTYQALLRLQARIPQLVVVDLSRNFGKEAALTAGLFEAIGDAVIPLDADLQDPPELIPEMVSRWRAGAEVVLAVRRVRDTDSWLRRKAAGAFYSGINAVSEIPIPPHAGDFRLMDRAVVDALRDLPERTRFNKGIFAWLGFRTEVIEYERPARHQGSSKWAFARLWGFAVDGFTSFSSLPLRVWSYLGVLVALAAIVYGGIVVFRTIFLGRDVAGYASLMTVLLLSTGIILIGLGVIGEYLSRVFIEVKSRPLFVIRSVRRVARGSDAGDKISYSRLGANAIQAKRAERSR